MTGSFCCIRSGQDTSDTVLTPRADPLRFIHVQIEVIGMDRPLERIQIELYQDRFEPVPGPLVKQAITGKDGVVEFNIAAGPYGVWPRALDMNSQWRYTGPTRFTFTKDETVRIQMRPAY
jgi:hypothetical protein